MKEPEYLDHVPDGWKVLEGAINYPKGFRWISNGKSRFDKDYKQALVPEEVAHEWRIKELRKLQTRHYGL